MLKSHILALLIIAALINSTVIGLVARRLGRPGRTMTPLR
jgi:hypothetical protein